MMKNNILKITTWEKFLSDLKQVLERCEHIKCTAVIRERPVFELVHKPTKKQPRNFIVSFPETSNQWVTPKFKGRHGLQHILQKGFAVEYNYFLKIKFDQVKITPSCKYFQTFVFLLCEIARRAEVEDPDWLTRDDTEKSIEKAIELDTRESYDYLVGIFTDKDFIRQLGYYTALQRMKPENPGHFSSSSKNPDRAKFKHVSERLDDILDTQLYDDKDPSQR